MRHTREVLSALTGTGVAAAAGLNAYIPLLAIGLLARFTDVVPLPEAWAPLTSWWVLGVLAVLLAIEVVADKVPAVDHVNDVIQTVVRPVSGGISFGATSGPGGTTTVVDDPGALFADGRWVPVVTGLAIALAVHLVKMAGRYVVNVTTLGFGAPVISAVEDAGSLLLAIVAILAPLLVVVPLGVLAYVATRVLRRWRHRRRARAAPAAL